jgi:gas vesicle protein
MMDNKNQELQEDQELGYHPRDTLGILLGVLSGAVAGGLAGALTMLLLAPQSGKETRKQITKESIELRDRTAKAMQDALDQVRTGANKIAAGGRHKVEELRQQGQDVAVRQLDRVSDAALAGKKAIQSS